MTLLPTSVPSKRLAESISSSSTAFILNSITGWDGSALTSSDFGTEAWGVLRDPNNSRIEFFKWDPTTIANGTTTGITVSLRGLKFTGDLSTEVTANKLTWTKNQTIVELGANPAQLYQWLKEYADDLAFAGVSDASATVKGIVEEATQAETDAGTTAGATAARLYVNPSTIRAGNYNDYVADTGAADAYVIAPSPAITSYVTGQIFVFKATNTNTGASTINVNSLGVKNIKKNVTQDLIAGDIVASNIYQIVYDGTAFQILAPYGATKPTVRTYVAADSPATWTKPTGLKYIHVRVQGAGGDGAKAGGGGGAYAEKTIGAASLGATETVTIGAAGVGSGNTSFGSHVTCGNGTDASSSTPGTGGTASGGDININGQNGGEYSGDSSNEFGGQGGGSILGNAGTFSSNVSATSAKNPAAATGYGAGGGGAADATDGSPTGTPGTGTQGIVIVTEYF